MAKARTPSADVRARASEFREWPPSCRSLIAELPEQRACRAEGNGDIEPIRPVHGGNAGYPAPRAVQGSSNMASMKSADAALRSVAATAIMTAAAKKYSKLFSSRGRRGWNCVGMMLAPEAAC